MFSIKLALRNIVRMPKRTVVNLILFLLVTASVTSGIIVYNATGSALENLDENYTFVASMVSSDPSQRDMRLDDFRICFDDEAVLAYNITFDNRIIFLPEDRLLHEFISEAELDITPVDSFYTDCGAEATNNLYLERGFFEGKYKMLSGGDFSEDAYDGNTPEIILPKWFADEHGISVGDKIIYYYDIAFYGGTFSMSGIRSVVVGIYENTENPLSHTESGAYIPMQFMMRSGVYGGLNSLVSGYKAPQFSVERADFVLHNRDAIYPFIENAQKSGIDISKIDIVFNNAEYDMIREGLINVRVVVAVLVIIVSSAGFGILLTFTVNTVMARRREKEVLRAVGMKKSAVALMFVIELLIIAILALPLGYISGRIASNLICRYADSTVEGNIEEMKLLEKGEDHPDYTIRPLNCNIKMSIANGTVETSVREFLPYRTEGADAGGVDVRLVTVYNTNVMKFAEAKTSVWTPITLAVVEDPGVLIVEDHREELIESGKLFDVHLEVYVPRSNGYQIGDRIMEVANPMNIEHTTRIGLITFKYLVVCGYFDVDLLELDGDLFLISEKEFAETEHNVYIEILPHCDMVINPTEK